MRNSPWKPLLFFLTLGLVFLWLFYPRSPASPQRAPASAKAGDVH